MHRPLVDAPRPQKGWEALSKVFLHEIVIKVVFLFKALSIILIAAKTQPVKKGDP